MMNLRFKKVMTVSKPERKVRLFRLMWEQGQMRHGGYSAKLAVSLGLKLLYLKREANGWRAAFCGIQVHLSRSYGGRFV